MAVKFGVFADLHVDIMHDPQQRLEAFLDACRKEDVDFIIELGDFCYPEENEKVEISEKTSINILNALNAKTTIAKKEINRLFNTFEKPSYHVLGNHECDMCSKETTLKYYGMEGKSYYSFDMGGFHFVVLDPNYYLKDGKFIAYERGNYFEVSYDDPPSLPFMPPEQTEWLREDLAKAQYPSIIFSHQRLIPGEYAAVRNYEPLQEVLHSAPKGVLMSINGHEHIDNLQYQDGIWYFNLNSISNCWLGTMFPCLGRYGEKIDEQFPNIRYVAPYKNPLFAIITMDEDGATVKGVTSEFVGPSPEELGCYTNPKSKFLKRLPHGPINAYIMDRYIPFK